MSDYTKTTDFAAKDGLASGNPSKAVVGTEIDDEFNNIATHVATKYDSTDLADTTTARALADDATLMTPSKVNDVLTNNDGILKQLNDINGTLADGLLGWDSSALADSEVVLFTAGVGLEFNGTTIEVVDGLDDIVALTPTDGNFMVGNGTEWVAESGATARASLGLTIGTNVQAWDANLDQIAALAVTDGNVMVGNGSAWVAESGATLRTSIGLGTGNAVTFASQTLTTSLTLGSAALTGPSSTTFEVAGRSVFMHNDATQTSAKIHFGTVAPTTEGSNGDIYYQYTA